MRKISFYIARTALVLLTVLSVFSCSNDDDLGNLSDTVFVRHKNADMPAYIHGNGSEKVFLITLHGGPGGNGLSFRGDAFNTIENNYAVVYFDQRGSGISQGNYDDNGISLDIMAEDVLALVKVLRRKYGNDSRFYLLGHSWGGLLGSAVLLKNQHEFLGWITVDGSHNPKGLYFEYITNFERVAAEQIEMGNSIEHWKSVQDILQEVDLNTFNQDDFFQLNSTAHQSEEILWRDGVFDKPEAGNDIIFDYNLLTFFWNLANTQNILDDQGIWENVSFTNRLHEIEIPSQILWGKHDLIVPSFFAQEAYDNLGSDTKELVFFERSGHAPMFSEPDQFATEVIRFMDQNK